jgi:thioredoxin reductase
VVVGSGPGGLQLSYSLTRLGVKHAVISADPGPGGMFRKWPLMQRLLSWTKPYALDESHEHRFERYDWNSLIADEPENRGLQVEFMDGTSSFPSRPEMEQGLTAFAERTGVKVRYDCRWEATRRAGEGFVLTTSDGEYRCPVAVFAVGVAAPWRPVAPGLDAVPHYGEMKSVQEYKGKRVFIVGKKNSAFEIANGLLPWARCIYLGSPSPAKLFIETHSLAGVRARYSQPFEDDLVAGGVFVMSASIDAVERIPAGYRVHTRASDSSAELNVDVDEVIAATGFVTPLGDLPDLGVTTFGQSRLPTQTPYWESTVVPGIYFAGTASQGSGGLRKHGIPSNSGAVQGHRYNARVLAAHIAETHFGQAPPQPALDTERLLPFLLDEIASGPELWHQCSYLARVVAIDSTWGARDLGIQPLAAFVDAGGPDAVAVTIEANAEGSNYPAVYVRHDGRLTEHLLDGHPLHDFRTEAHQRALASALKPVLGAAARVS